MWYNDERPLNFDEVKGQDIIVKGIRSQSMRNKFFPVYIFGGQYGAGKTTMGRIVSRAANCEHRDAQGNPCLECPACKSILAERCQDVVEMDGASNTSVDDIRKIKDSINYLPSEVSKKVYIIDEVHMLSKGAFNALLKLLEETPEHVIFILCTTDVKMIPNTVKSRAAKYTFLPIQQDVIKDHIQRVAQKHNVEIDEPATVLLAKNSNGSMRDALSLLEQAAEQPEDIIKEDIIKEMLGITEPTQLFTILQGLFTNDVGAVLDNVQKFMSLGKDSFMMVSDMLDILADGVVAYYQGAENVCNSQHYIECLRAFLANIDVNSIYTVMNGLMDIRDELKRMPGSTTLVCGIIRMLSDEKGAYAKMAQKVAKLEKDIMMLSQGVSIVRPVSDTQPFDDSEANNQAEELNNVVSGAVSQEHIQTIGDTVKDSTSFEETQEEETNSNDECQSVMAIESAEYESHEEELHEEELGQEEEMSETTHPQQVDKEGIEAESEDIKKQVSKEQEETTETNSQDNDSDVIDVDDPFAIINMFAAFSNTLQSKPKEVKEESSTNSIDYDKYLLDLYQDPVIENALEIGCKRRYEDHVLFFETEVEEIYNLIKAYDETRKFPFNYKLLSV